MEDETRVRGALVGVLAVLALCLLGPASAAAAPTWLAPQGLADAVQTAYSPTVAAAPDGTVLATWARSDGPQIRIQARVRPPGGEFGPAVSLSAPGADALQPVPAFDAQGNAIVVWSRAGRVEGALRPAGGEFAAARVVSPETESASAPTIAFDARGDATIAWAGVSGTSPNLTYRVRARTWRADGGFGEPQQLTSATMASANEALNFGSIKLAADGLGSVFAVWAFFSSSPPSPSEPLGRSASSIGAAVQPAGGSFALPATTLASGEEWITPGWQVRSPAIAVDRGGNALVIWSQLMSVGGMQSIEAKARPVGGTFQPTAEIVYGPGPQAFEPSVAFDDAGNAVAVWLGQTGGKASVLAAERSAGGGFGAPRVLSTPGVLASYPDLAITARGEALVAWVRGGTSSQIEAVARPPGGSFSAPRPVSPVAGEINLVSPTLAADGQGDAVAIWQLLDGQYIPELAGYDAVGPALVGLSVPDRGAAGVPLSFSVSPRDVWSPLAATSWSFGDSGTASGTAVAHTFTTGGEHLVTVTASDAVGNTSSASRSIAIAAPAPAPAATEGPVVSHLRQSHRRWREGGKLARISVGSRHGRGGKGRHRPPVGTSFTFSLNHSAKVGFSFARHLPGRKAGRRCVPQTRRNRRHRACRRIATRGNLAVAGKKGPNRVRFEGRLSRTKRLGPGRYTLTIIASDAAGRRSAPRRLDFTVVGRRR